MGLSRKKFLQGAGAALCSSRWLGCSPKRAPAFTLPEKTNVLLIILDTVGAQHVSSFGLKEPLTPTVDRLVEQGVSFQQAYSSAPWTKPAIASMLTGLMPNRCGMSNISAVLGAQVETVATAFRKKRYRTAAVVSHFFLQGDRFGFGQGFDQYDDRLSRNANPHQSITSQDVTGYAIQWINQHRADPFFLMTHYFDPHDVFFAHPEFDRTRGYKGTLQPGIVMRQLQTLLRENALSQEDVRYLTGLHHEEIAYTDHHVGKLLSHLEKCGLSENTLVVLAADHGDAFAQHNWLGHTATLYNELIHVPFLFCLPGRISPGKAVTPVSTVDVWQTLADLFRLQKPAYPLDGRSLVPYLRTPAETDTSRAVFSEVDYTPAKHTAIADELVTFKTSLIMDDHKLIHDRRKGSWEFYDLQKDPLEQADLSGKLAFEASFRRELADWEKRRAPIQIDVPGFLKPDEVEKLKSLGYLR